MLNIQRSMFNSQGRYFCQMIQADYLIVGHGIGGALLSHCLNKAGANIIVIDEDKPNTASKVAAGLINPVTGRRLVKSWMIDELLRAVEKVFGEIDQQYNINCLYEKELTWFLPAPDMVQAFEKRIAEQTGYLLESSSAGLLSQFNFPYKTGNVKPCYIVDLQQLLPALRSQLERSGRLLNEKFDHERLVLKNEEIQYEDIHCKKIIFCEGSAAINNPWFCQLPYSLNKGEALILEIKDLPKDKIYKFRQTLVPLPGIENYWWYGSNYIWEFKDDQPTAAYREAAEKELRAWLRLPFKIIEHKAAIRYATVERRPFIGFHPLHTRIGIFNGWGTKGCSLVPFFAEQFVNSMLHHKTLMPETDVKRFSNLLQGSGKAF